MLRSTKDANLQREKKCTGVDVIVNKIEFKMYLNNIKLKTFIHVNTKFCSFFLPYHHIVQSAVVPSELVLGHTGHQRASNPASISFCCFHCLEPIIAGTLSSPTPCQQTQGHCRF